MQMTRRLSRVVQSLVFAYFLLLTGTGHAVSFQSKSVTITKVNQRCR